MRIELLAPKHYSKEFPLIRDFLAYKKCCFCIPASAGESEAGWTKKREKWPADKLSLSAVAIDEATNKVVGFVHCSGFGHPCDMHSPKEHEIYVDEVMVEESLRRRGIGTQLMNWVEDTARSRGATTLSLLVLKGNPSRGLYERLGYESKGPPGGAHGSTRIPQETYCAARRRVLSHTTATADRAGANATRAQPRRFTRRRANLRRGSRAHACMDCASSS